MPSNMRAFAKMHLIRMTSLIHHQDCNFLDIISLSPFFFLCHFLFSPPFYGLFCPWTVLPLALAQPPASMAKDLPPANLLASPSANFTACLRPLWFGERGKGAMALL